jgi:hypothetical protein
MGDPNLRPLFDKTKARHATDWTESPQLAARAILDGIPLGRRLTRQERLTIAVAACAPTHHLTITSNLSRDEVLHRFGLLKRRWATVRGYPWIYVGTCVVTADGKAGHHLHLLLWEQVFMKTFNRHLKDLGFGHAKIDQIKPRDGTDPFTAAFGITAYVLGQEEAVLGAKDHLENQRRPKGERAFLMPQRSTLAARNPKLLEARDDARNPALTDDQLIQRLP